MEPTLNNLLAHFQTASANYAVAIRPYALDLFWALFTIDILITGIQFVADGQGDPQYFLGRLFRHILGGGFTLAMLANGPIWMGYVIQGFSEIGARLTGLPSLNPDGIIKVGVSLGSTLMNSPAGTGIVQTVGLAIVAAVISIVIVVCFVAAALELFLTLVYAYLGLALGVILLAFGGLRYTSPFAEGYFQSVIRTSIKILFIYAVLGIGMGVVTDWNTALLAACKPTETAVPWITSYSTPPTAMMTTVCTGSISLSNMFGFLAMALVFAACMIAIPRMAGNLTGGSIGRGLEHVAEALFVGRAVGGAVRSAMRATSSAAGGATSAVSGWMGSSAAQQFAAQSAATAKQSGGSSGPTAPLNPFSDASKPPGYNFRGPSSPLAAGRGLPAPKSGPGSGGAALEYQPGRPGGYTKAFAVDITDSQDK